MAARPRPARRVQINIIVSDGDMESCQLVKIRVVEPGGIVRPV